MKNEITNIFFVGAPKCGTTSFAEALKKIDFIEVSEPKEINYFSKKKIMDNNYYYKKIYLCTSFSQWEKSFTLTEKTKFRCDFSVSYFDDINAAINIKEKFPNNSKIVIVLRNPVDRALSHYRMDKKLGLISKDLNKIFHEKNSIHFDQYFNISNYYSFVKNYINIFGANNVLIIPFSKINDSNYISKIFFDFIKIQTPTKIKLKTVNSSLISSNSIVNLLFKTHPIRKFLKFIIPFKLKNLLLNKFFTTKQVIHIDINVKDYLNKDTLKLKRLIKYHYNSHFDF